MEEFSEDDFELSAVYIKTQLEEYHPNRACLLLSTSDPARQRYIDNLNAQFSHMGNMFQQVQENSDNEMLGQAFRMTMQRYIYTFRETQTLARYRARQIITQQIIAPVMNSPVPPVTPPYWSQLPQHGLLLPHLCLP